MNGRLTSLLIRLILLAQPRELRRRFGAEILRDVRRDLHEAAAHGRMAVMRASLVALADALGSLRRRREIAARTTSMSRAVIPMRWIRDAANDIRFGLRGLRRNWTFSASVIATLALGIGLNAAMFGVADRLLLRGPEHLQDAARLRRVQITSQARGQNLQQSGLFGYPGFDALRQAASLDGVAAYNIAEDAAVIGSGLEAMLVNRGEATASFFPLLGVRPALGRFFTNAEDDTVAPRPVAVLGYGLWQRYFGGRQEVIGETVMVNNTAYAIVGVAPQGFTGPDLTRVDIWFPESWLGQPRMPNWTQAWGGWWLSVVVRLKPGVTDAQADGEMTAAFRRAAAASSAALAKATLAGRPLLSTRDGTRSMESRVSTWLVAVAAIVFVVACANAVSLMLAHGLGRRREIAVRIALGAGRSRLVRLLLVEALMLATVGGAVGLAVAYVVGTAMRARLIASVDWPTGPVSGRVLVMCTGVSIAAGLIVGLLPAIRASAADVSTSLKSGVREGGGQRRSLRHALTLVQATLSVLLLVGAGLFVTSLARVQAIDLGLQPDRVVTISFLRPPLAAIADPAERALENARRTANFPEVLERLRARPDVEAASLVVGLAFMGSYSTDIKVPGLDAIPRLKGGGPFLTAVTADFFRTVGTRIVRGRAFRPDEGAGTAPAAIVNETMAATLWPNQDAIGRCFTIVQPGPEACAEVVGIAADTRHRQLQEDASMAYYIPLGQQYGVGAAQVLVRPRGSIETAVVTLRRDLLAADPSLTFVNAGVLQDRWDPLVRPWRLGATMFLLMGVLALVVAALGLYSVTAYFVSQRTQEIGVRMALGARPGDVARLIVRSGVVLASGGIVVGFVIAVVAGRFLEPMLFQTSPRDPRVFTFVAFTVVAMAVIATLLPAARARRVNPVDAMRTE